MNYNTDVRPKIYKDFVSVVIPTFNSQKDIVRNLISIKNQTYSKIEVIVVDDASTDRTYEISKKYADKAFKRRHAERSIQRNFGAAKSAGEYLLFLDSDMELMENVIKECMEIIKKDKSIGGIVIPEESIASNYWEKVKAFERSFYNLEGDELVEAARFFRKNAFKKVGGYDETITGPEDWDLPEKIKKNGYKIIRIKHTLIYHYESIKSPLQVAKKKYYYALKSYRYLNKQNISPLSAKTIYFLRPVFYKNWKRFLSNPYLSAGMLIMLTLELVGGGIGFLVGRYKYK